ncbi:MAG: amino acid permease [Candidatus Dormiibacterota bacterium]
MAERVESGSAAVQPQDPDAQRLAALGYRQELSRVLTLFEKLGVAFCYLCPMVGIYSLFTLGAGSAGPRNLWLMPIVVFGQLLVSLVFAELGSHYPIAGALFHWSKNLIGRGYGWWVGWICGWALILTVASVDTGFVIYASPLLHNLFGTNINAADPNTILLFTRLLLAVQTVFNVAGGRLLGNISKIGVYVEILGTLGIAILLAAVGFHHSIGFLFTTQGTENLAHNPLGVNFGGNWWLGAALVATLAHVYIFYGFESAGDVAEEVRSASKQAPRAIVSSLLIGGLTSFILVAALLLAIPSGGNSFTAATSLSGGVPYILSANVHVAGIQDFILILVCFAFFSCGNAVQGAEARLVFSDARDRAIPGSHVLRYISPRFETPVNAVLLAAILPAQFTLLVHISPSKPIVVGFVTYPADVTPLTALVSFGVSGIYLSFLTVVLAAVVARLRGWKAEGTFRLGAWAWPVLIGAAVYGARMLANILIPTGINGPKGELFNFGWLTLLVVVFICLIGALYFFLAHPHRRPPEQSRPGAAQLSESEPASL